MAESNESPGQSILEIPEVRSLVRMGRGRAYLTDEEIQGALSDIDLEESEFDEIYADLESEGITIRSEPQALDSRDELDQLDGPEILFLGEISVTSIVARKQEPVGRDSTWYSLSLSAMNNTYSGQRVHLLVQGLDADGFNVVSTSLDGIVPPGETPRVVAGRDRAKSMIFDSVARWQVASVSILSLPMG
ncbi:MAG TPA: RNA polymerase sigma factor region1.1 domain-containing protein [Coriobacteriia bacterium]|nr:RNA polymerase sigma factor region1.1 domain-containing protein [Coriobacteriia bacterium]